MSSTFDEIVGLTDTLAGAVLDALDAMPYRPGLSEAELALMNMAMNTQDMTHQMDLGQVGSRAYFLVCSGMLLGAAHSGAFGIGNPFAAGVKTARDALSSQMMKHLEESGV